MDDLYNDDLYDSNSSINTNTIALIRLKKASSIA